MLGYVAPSNDVFIFFEDDEIAALLEKRKIQGSFVNFRNPDLIVPLEVAIDDTIDDRIKTDGEKDCEGNFTRYSLLMKQREYERFNERRQYGLHEGSRHVNLIDTKKMTFGEESNYQQMCDYRTQNYKPET